MTKLIIDGSNLRSGGGVTHIVELLNSDSVDNSRFSEIIIFSNKNTLSKIKENPKIKKYTHSFLDKSLVHIVFWKFFYFEPFLKKINNGILLDPAGTYSGNFRPYVSMSRNMLIFEETESKRFPELAMRLKFRLLRLIQTRTFNRSTGIIFISKYARQTILPFLRKKTPKDFRLINHGVSKRFLGMKKQQKSIDKYNSQSPFSFLYVSPITVYKHQTKLVEAFYLLREQGLPLILNLVGDQYDPEYKKFIQVCEKYDALGKFVFYHGKQPYEELSKFYMNCDGIIFASSCENMPNVLIESMSSGNCVLSSNMGPMPEFLGNDYPFLFNPLDVNSIKSKIDYYLRNEELRSLTTDFTLNKSMEFNWEKCSNETFNYLYEKYDEN